MKRSVAALLLLALAAAAIGAAPALATGVDAGASSDVALVLNSDRGSIEGTVVDTYTGQPVFAADVVVVGTGMG
ncbi:MAG TPA: hypothetical protein VE960_00830, partial [bacterium]|nr:hypothetical protein [bacterium]